MSDDRIVTAARVDEDAQYEAGLRPRVLDDYIGQDRVRENLQVSIAAARQRSEALDHVLLYGPPGLGKTTLAYVISDLRTSRRAAILEDFRNNPKILSLFKQGLEELGGTKRGL